MRANLPVTQREYDFPDDATLMSTTDPQSYVTYANAAFIQVSGFKRDEIIGEPHNFVRHPDMPTEAFADMWATLKAGRSWTAVIKNRRKDGDHYWVRANATPVIRNGQLVGYMSVRTKPSREEIAQADALYRDLREHRARGRKFHQGLVVRTGLFGWMSLLQTMSARWRVRAALLALLAGSAWTAFLFGLHGVMFEGFAATETVLLLLAECWLAAQITAPLQRVLKQSLAVAAGQAGDNVHLNRVDEIGMIMRAVNQAGLNLRSLVDDVSEQLSGLQGASGKIAAGNDDLSGRSEQAAASLEETAASMEQMTATVRNNADTATQAGQLAGSTSAAAEKGDAVVGQVVATMGEISASSRKISEIIGVIDSIAFQTNILALNAAVEAARAGEQGRGFAVVAAEVRTLAQRSANAAKEIAALIHDSVQKTAAGSALVDQAGDAMNEIRSQVAQVAGLIGEIGSATREQSDGIGQVNVAVTQLDKMTQQNAALVQESASTADELKRRTQRLVDAVAVFRVNARVPARHDDARGARSVARARERFDGASPRAGDGERGCRLADVLTGTRRAVRRLTPNRRRSRAACALRFRSPAARRAGSPLAAAAERAAATTAPDSDRPALLRCVARQVLAAREFLSRLVVRLDHRQALARGILQLLVAARCDLGLEHRQRLAVAVERDLLDIRLVERVAAQVLDAVEHGRIGIVVRHVDTARTRGAQRLRQLLVVGCDARGERLHRAVARARIRDARRVALRRYGLRRVCDESLIGFVQARVGGGFGARLRRRGRVLRGCGGREGE